MATRICASARRTLQASDISAAARNAVSKLRNSNSNSKSSQSLLFNAAEGRASSFLGSAASNNQTSAQKIFVSSRVPVALGCADSLMPLHSATASALFTSMLSLHSQSWGCLSEGFATPL